MGYCDGGVMVKCYPVKSEYIKNLAQSVVYCLGGVMVRVLLPCEELIHEHCFSFQKVLLIV